MLNQDGHIEIVDQKVYLGKQKYWDETTKTERCQMDLNGANFDHISRKHAFIELSTQDDGSRRATWHQLGRTASHVGEKRVLPGNSCEIHDGTEIDVAGESAYDSKAGWTGEKSTLMFRFAP